MNSVTDSALANQYTDSMFSARLPRPWPSCALLFASLIAAPALAQTPGAVPAATPAPASTLPSVPAPTPAGAQSATDQQQQTQPTAQPQSESQPQPAAPEPAVNSYPATPAAPQTQTQPATANPAAPAVTPPDQLEQPIRVPQQQNQQNPTTTPSTVYMPQAVPIASVPSIPAYGPLPGDHAGDPLGSTYIPVDSIVYPLALRLYSMGYLDSAFITMRPWTRRSLLHMLQATSSDVMADGDPEAESILAKLQEYLADEAPGQNLQRGAVYGVQSVYTRVMGIGGPVLRDSFHLGQTVYNDYGRPYSTGFNNVTGFSSVNEYGPFSLYVRGELQHAPSYEGYSFALANQLSNIDQIFTFAPPNDPQATIPYGNTGSVTTFALQEANLSAHLWHHEISFGKSDSWLGPGMGGAMAYSNNAQDVYSFRINMVDPLYIPLLSKLVGPLRYDFMIGSLKGHTAPEDPWMHAEAFSFKPTKNFEFSFERTVIWGGKGHGCINPDNSVYPCNEPITIHTFLKSFFSLSDTTTQLKYSRDDPGARYSAFTFSYRLPFVRKYVTLYTDSIAHDDVTPISAPRRAAYRPGVYISHLPHLEKMDFRIEAASTDTSTLRSLGGQFNYFETIQKQGYTNKGYIFGDWIGREAKGGNAWLTYHLSGNEWVQLEYMNKKGPKDFIPLGTTQNQFTVDVVKNLRKDIQLNAWMQYERWKAPIYKAGQQNDVVVAAQIKFYPKLHTNPEAAAVQHWW